MSTSERDHGDPTTPGSRLRRPSRLDQHIADMLQDTGYDIQRKIGSGGMGIVYLAKTGDGSDVALKVLRPEIADDPRARARLQREVRALQRTRSDNIAQVIDAELDSPEAFLVTEYIPGPTLESAVRAHGRLHLEAVREIGVVLGETLELIHDCGIVHRDLKPSNIMLRHATAKDLTTFDPDGQRLDPVIIDFGIAQAADDSRLTSTGLMMGTAAYMDPEVIKTNEAGPASDWWAWAALVAFAATGREPFGTGRPDALFLRAERGDVDVDGLPTPLQKLLREALDPDPSRRTPPLELLDRLARLDMDDFGADDDAGPGAAGVAAGLASGAALGRAGGGVPGAGGAAPGADEGASRPFGHSESAYAETEAPDPYRGADHAASGREHPDLETAELGFEGTAERAGDAGQTGDADQLDRGRSDGPRTEVLEAGDSTATLPQVQTGGAGSERYDRAYEPEHPGGSFDPPTQPLPRIEESPTRPFAPIAAPVRDEAPDFGGAPSRGDAPDREGAWGQRASAPVHVSAPNDPYGYGTHAYEHGGGGYAGPARGETGQTAALDYGTPGQGGAGYGAVGQHKPEYAAAPLAPQYRKPRKRGFLVFLGVLLLIGLGAVAPLTALILFVLLNAFGRAWQRSWVSATRSREKGSGAGMTNAGIVSLAIPRFLWGIIESVLLALFPVGVGLVLAVVADAILGWGMRIGVPLGVYGAVIMVTTIGLCWIGIDGKTTRYGAHRVADAAAPERMWTTILVILMLALLAAIAGTIASRGGTIDYFPYLGQFRVEDLARWRN